jgi:hypothetical protein
VNQLFPGLVCAMIAFMLHIHLSLYYLHEWMISKSLQNSLNIIQNTVSASKKKKYIGGVDVTVKTIPTTIKIILLKKI